MDIIVFTHSESSGQARLTISASARNRLPRVGDDLSMLDMLHVTYYFRHVHTAKKNDTVYIVVIRVVDAVANHSRILSSDTGNVCRIIYTMSPKKRH